MTKKIKITSRGRYVSKQGKVIFGPSVFFKEEIDTLRYYLTKYPNIGIVEETAGKRLVNLNLENVDKNNDKEPISMMEDVTPTNNVSEQVKVDNKEVAPTTPEEPEVEPEQEPKKEFEKPSMEPVVEQGVEETLESEGNKAEEDTPEEPEVEQEPKKEDIPEQKSNNNNYKKKNKNFKSTEVKPREV